MLINASQVSLPLHPGQLAHIDLVPRTRLRGVAGHSWITLDNDRRDIVLGPGEEFIADSTVRAIVCALHGNGAAELLVLS